MKITVKRTGGVAGLTRTWQVLIDEQPDREDWLTLIDALPWWSRPPASRQTDRFIYVIRVSRRRITLAEQQLEGPWRELVQRVREVAAE